MQTFQEKIIAPAQIGSVSRKAKNQNQKIVFTNGCFDILHLGHLSYLQKARSCGNLMIVALNSDDSVKRLKGPSRPINELETRLAAMASLFFVDYATWFEEDTPYNIIKEIMPQVLLKGGDWKPEQIVGSDIVLENGGEVLSIDFIEGKSTTGTIEKILKSGGNQQK